MKNLKNKAYGTNKLLLILLFSILYSSVYSQTYYFSNSGDDSYTEEQAQNPDTPWKTLDKLNSLTLNPGATVLFKRGDTWRGEITVNSGGDAGNPITFGSYGTGEKPVIKGSILVTDWTQYSGNIYKSTVSEKVVQLFCNDKRQTLARYPNTGYARFDKVNSSTSFNSDDVGSTDWTGGMAQMRLKHWTFGTQKITSCNNGAMTIKNAPHYDPQVGWGFFINNHFAALDAPGEWYYDVGDSSLYFWAPNGDSPDNYTIEASVINYGFKINSGSNIIIDGFTLKHQIFSSIEATDSGSDYITIRNNEIYGTDQIAIRMGESMWASSGMDHITIDNNVIDGANRNGIFFSVAYSSVTNNVIKHIGDDYTKLSAYGVGNYEHASIAVDVHGRENLIRENRVDSIGYIGIHFAHAPKTIVEYNYVTNYCKSTDDGGGIYCYQMYYDNEDVKGSIIRYNIVTDGIGAPEATDNPDYYAVEGIYLDNRSQEVTVLNNTVSKGGSRGYFTNNGRGHKFLNNISYNNKLAQIYFREVSESIEEYEIKGNIFYSLNSDQLCVQQFSSISSKTEFGTYDNNYYCNPYSISLIKDQNVSYTLEGWQDYSGQDANSHKSLIDSDDLPYTYGPQLISNSTFDSNISGWSFWSNTGDAKNTWEENSLLDDGTLKHNPGSSSTSYASHNISIEEGKLYEVKFSIVSNTSKSLNVAVIRNHGNYATLGFFTTITVNTNRQDFTYQFEATETEPGSMIYFYNAYNQSTPVFWLDNVSIKEIVSKPSPEEVSPLFMNPTMETVTVDLGGKVYRDLDGNKVSGNISLEPFTSKILTILVDSDTIPPEAPANLLATAVSSSRIDLDWDDNTESDLEGYTVMRATTSGGPYTSIATGVASSNYSDIGLTPETTYYYVVTAKDNSNNISENSAEASATTLSSEPLPAPYSFYDFEEGSGISVADLGTLKNNGTLTGTDIDWASGGVKYSDSEEDGCVQITGSPTTGRSYVKVPYNDLYNSYDYTFSAWVKWDTSVAPNWAYVFWQNGDDSNKTRHVDMWWDKENRTVATSMNDENGGSIRIRPTGTSINVFDGNWHLVAITMENGTNVKLWVDGQKTGELNSTTKIAINGGDDLWLGAKPETDPDGVTKMVGLIDRVGIYDKALTAGQISELYTTRSSFGDPSTGIEGTDNASMFKLYQNIPNPFSSETTIAYELKQPGFVTLQVFDMAGKIVATLEQSKKPAGSYRVKWNRLNASNNIVPNGIYLYKLTLVSKDNVFSEVKKIVVK